MCDDFFKVMNQWFDLDSEINDLRNKFNVYI